MKVETKGDYGCKIGMEPSLTEKERNIVLKRLQDTQTWRDIENAHVEADDILCEVLLKLGYKDIVDEFVKVHKWYA